MTAEPPVPGSLAAASRRHALGWLVAGNAIGLWLAALLLWPAMNDAAAPFTYGRWVPLHLDWQLYGWCALPLAVVLLQYYLPADARGRTTGRLALAVWSAGLALGGVTWLAGLSSGKLFLEWSGPARVAWPLAMFVVWLLIAIRVWPRRREFPWWAHGLLAGLAVVPFVLWWAADPRIYPAVDPDTGGATGSSLLGSTLGLVGIFGLLPFLLRLPATTAADRRGRLRLYGVYLVVSFGLNAALKRGNITHHDGGHIFGLASLALWVPLVWRYARSFVWPASARPWLVAAFAWWLVLVVTGFITFLPAMGDRFKFTNGLVAHAHLAMAGLVTSLHVALLATLGRGWRAGRRWSFWTWQLACVVHIGALFWLGWREAAEPALLYVRGGVADWCYGLRLAAGGAMFVAALDWLVAAWRHDQE
jgi:cytochrome c oxidase cbb3-type subunit 1